MLKSCDCCPHYCVVKLVNPPPHRYIFLDRFQLALDECQTVLPIINEHIHSAVPQPGTTAPLLPSRFVAWDCSDGSFAQQLVLGHSIPELSSVLRGGDLLSADSQQLLRTLQDSFNTSLHQWNPLEPSDTDWSRWRNVIVDESKRLAFLVSKYGGSQ